MLRISNLSLARGVKVLLDNATLTVHPGHKVGLIGANGSGKTTLFALLRGEISQEKGELSMPPAWVIAHVAQEAAPTATSAIDYVLDGDRELRIIERELAAAQADETADAHSGGEHLAELHHRFELVEGYSARARAASLLSGLGFPVARHHDAVSMFSGGWRMRLNLAQALMCRSDLLLLDEPTNHLDLDAVLWLEDWLERYPGTLLLITHDRDFLDAVVGEIVHLDQRELRHYTGNYAQFERERAQSLALQQSAYVKQQKQIAHLRSYIERFRAKATKAKQAQSRIKTLERMEMIAAAHVDSPFSFELKARPIAARQLLKLDDVTLGYGAAPILEHVDWAILAGERIGLLGPNGAGKSTLLRAIAGAIAPLSGDRLAANGLRIGYFAQHQVEQLRLAESAMWHLQRLEPSTRDQELRDFLGGFDFRGERATSAVRDFSGGEKARLTLALLARQKPNLLLLDEPTNHLDIDMREALTEALQDYTGALIVVAHDRHLLRATADELWLVADGKVSLFDGDLDDYRRWVLTGRMSDAPRATETSPADSATAAPTTDRRAQKRVEAEARQQSYAKRKPLTDRLALIEKELEAIGTERQSIEAWLTTPEAYAEEGKDKLRGTIARQGDLTWQLARLEAEWLEASDALEKIGA